MEFHKSFNGLLDSFRLILAACTYLQISPAVAKKHFEPFPYLIELICSVTNKSVKIDKAILDLVEKEGCDGKVLLYSKTLTDFYRIFTIAVKDIIWQESDFKNLLSTSELKFLGHLRNASAHHNKFYFGRGKERSRILSHLPITWRNKEISQKSEAKDLYLNFMKPGDLFILLSDISKLVSKN